LFTEIFQCVSIAGVSNNIQSVNSGGFNDEALAPGMDMRRSSSPAKMRRRRPSRDLDVETETTTLPCTVDFRGP